MIRLPCSHTVDEEPVSIHAALGETGKLPFQRMLHESFRQRTRGTEQPEDVLERFKIQGVTRKFSLQAAEIAFEPPREDNLPHRRLR